MICPTCPLTNAAGHFVYWFHFFTPQCCVCVCCTCRLGLQSFTLTRVSHWSQRMQGGAHVRCAVPQANNGFAGDKSSPAALVRTTKWPEKNEKEKESMFLRNPREVKNEHIVMFVESWILCLSWHEHHLVGVRKKNHCLSLNTCFGRHKNGWKHSSAFKCNIRLQYLLHHRFFGFRGCLLHLRHFRLFRCQFKAPGWCFSYN